MHVDDWIGFRSTHETLAGVSRAFRELYSIEQQVGSGGTATVYSAVDLKHQRRVAVKVLRTEVCDAIGHDRFLREIRLTAQLHHPNIMQLFDSGSLDGFLYYVMPLADQSLRRRLATSGTVEIDEAVGICGEAADALNCAHSEGIVHRDLKPENILFAGTHAVVADFGLAKALGSGLGDNLTRSGFPLGTLGYMSPEQAAGRVDIDGRTDVFSLTCVMYESLVGETPGTWTSDRSVEFGRFDDVPAHHRERLDMLPGLVESVLVRGLCFERNKRFESPLQLAQALRNAVMSDREYGEGEAREVMDSAALLGGGEPDEAVFSYGSIRRIAAEAGIEPRFIDRAIAHREEAERGIEKGGYFGSTGRIALACATDGALAAADKGAILHEIRRVVGQAGRIVETLDDSLQWEFKPGFGEWARQVQVSLTQDREKTRLNVVQHVGQEAVLQIISATAGTAVAGAAGLVALRAGLGSVGAIFATSATWIAQYSLFRLWFWSVMVRRLRTMSMMMKRLKRYIEQLM